MNGRALCEKWRVLTTMKSPIKKKKKKNTNFLHKSTKKIKERLSKILRIKINNNIIP